MSITKKLYGVMSDNKEVFLYTLDNGKNVKTEIITYGAIIKNLWVKDKNGEYTDVVLGRDTLEEYFNNEGYFGAVIGRVANRIYRGKFTINGKEYNVPVNDKGKNSLHGGDIGFDKYVWEVVEVNDTDEPSLKLKIISPDGDQGYPGNLVVYVTYTINEKDGLVIRYEAESDKDTIVNLTNHSYFNPNGIGNGNIYDLDLQLNCDFYTPNNEEGLPHGEILSVKGTPFDFTQTKKVGKDIGSDYEQLKMFKGYDHNFIINGTGFRKAGVVTSTKTGISMEVYTDKPGLQFYCGSWIEEGRICKNSLVYKIHEALCIETQYFPDAVNYSHFKSPLLKAGEKYEFTTEYRFLNK